MRQSKGEKIFCTFNEIFMIALGMLCFAPLMHIISISLSRGNMVAEGLVTFWPRGFTTRMYEIIIRRGDLWAPMEISIRRTLIGWAVNVFISLLVAYPLSKSNLRFKHRTFFAWFFFIPMIVNGGLIPNYILIKELNLIDNIWSLILPTAVPVFYILIMLNFFRGLPTEFEESALMEGAGQWRILFNIYAPLSLPAIATISVYILVFHWNSWFDGLIYMNNPANYPLMTLLQATIFGAGSNSNQYRISSRTLNAVIMIMSMLPIIVAYPFMQRYFIKGLVLGGVKG